MTKTPSLVELAEMRDMLASIPRGARIVDSFSLETVSRRVVLEEDRMDLWNQLTAQSHSHQPILWAKENMRRALQNNPEVLLYWATQDDVRAWEFVNKVGRHIDFMEEAVLLEERLAMLQGVSCERAAALTGLLSNALQHMPQAFSNLSPAWIGYADSPLRKQVESFGWQPDMLPGMCRNHAHFVNADTWVPFVAYPYTLWLLEYLKAGPNKNDPPMWHTQEKAYFLIANNANPHDAVMAKALLMQSPELQEKVSFGIPEKAMQACVALPQSERSYFESLVATHMSLGLEKDLGLHLAKQSAMAQPDGYVLSTVKLDDLILPELGHD